jgi:HEAT repeat protein
MTEKKAHKTNPELIAELTSGSEPRILKAIAELREKGNPLYLPFLLDLLTNSPGEEVSRNILELLGNLKDKETIPYLVGAIRAATDKSLRRDLVTCCWKNSLDFSEYLSFFTDMVIDSDFEVAFEALTVIDNLGQFPPAEIRDVEIMKVRHAMQFSQGIQKDLLRELIDILS